MILLLKIFFRSLIHTDKDLIKAGVSVLRRHNRALTSVLRYHLWYWIRCNASQTWRIQAKK